MQRIVTLSGRLRIAAFVFTALAACLALGTARQAMAKGTPDKAELDRLRKLQASIEWIEGPAVGKLGNRAEIKIPKGYRFTGQQGAAAFAELTENIPNPSELGVLISEADEWYISFSYDDSGYVKDDEKAELDADAILTSLRAGNDSANVERRSRGWPELSLAGWITPPAYDAGTHHLVWALLCKGEGGASANYNTRILGRTGVMSATLVVGPEQMEAQLPTVKSILADFQFNAGSKYSEWRAGDKVAQYGLTGLITGGAVVGAAKLGLLAKLGKFIKVIVVGALALGAGIWRFLTGRGRREAE